MERTFETQRLDMEHNYSRLKFTTVLIVVTAVFFFIFVYLGANQHAVASEIAQQDASAVARQLQLEGTRLQLQGNLKEAIKKYEESISYKPNPRLTTLVETLQKQIGRKEKAAVVAIPVEKPTVTPTQEEQAAAPVVTETKEVVQQEEHAAAIERIPVTHEEELIYAFTDWALDFFSDSLQAAKYGIETNHNYSITSEGGQYEVRLDPFIFHIDETDSFDLSPLILSFQPQGNNKLAVEAKISNKGLLLGEDKIVAEMLVGSQKISGVWDRALQSFDHAEIKLEDLSIADSKTNDRIEIKEFNVDTTLSNNAEEIWEGKYQGHLSGLSLFADEVDFTIDNINFLYNLGGSKFRRYTELNKIYQSMFRNLKNMQLSDMENILVNLDEYIQFLNFYRAQLTIEGISVKDEETFKIGSFELAGDLQKEAADNKYVFNSKIDAKGISFTDKESPENKEPVSVSLDNIGFASNGELKQFPPNQFSKQLTVIKGLENLEEQETEDYLTNHAMNLSKELLGLLSEYQAEISLNGLNTVNAMPTPVTLDIAKIGGGFAVNSGQGGKIDTHISFSGFNGFDQEANNIPQSASFNFELKNIPSIFNLISDPTSLAEGDLDEVQQQVMMNGMNTFMASTLTLSLTDSFVAFPASRFNLDCSANVDKTAKFYSIGSVKIAIENPDDFMKIAQSFGADPSLQQMLATITALANRTNEDEKVIDRIDARIDQDGKVIINTKDVTRMFFPSTPN